MFILNVLFNFAFIFSMIYHLTVTEMNFSIKGPLKLNCLLNICIILEVAWTALQLHKTYYEINGLNNLFHIL